ncbi:MAG: GNAT family N-acetyltransferase [Nanoarchaeota archaeon]|nr:GNAT family N-acetyltransferase [Nanoarchaeota archaeon]
MEIKTKRLILRQPTMKYAKDLIENINNLDVSKWLLVAPYPYTMKDAKWYINHCEEKAKEKTPTSYEFSIELKSEKKIIGGCGISGIDYDQGIADLGYWLGEKYWRQGIITETINELINYSFNKLKLRRLQIPIFSDNIPSNNVAKKFGFTFEGVLRKKAVCKATGKIHDENLWSLLKEEWKN